MSVLNNEKVALICIAKNEDNYIQEWVDYHLNIGFDNIFIYENNWRTKLTNDKVTIIPFDDEVKQIEAYNHFIQNNQDYTWGAFIDVDEFIVLKKHQNIKLFIENYSNTNSIAINWVLFGDNNISNVINNNYSVIDRFTKRQIGVNNHIKTISYLKLTQKAIYLDPHHSNQYWIDTNFNRGIGPFNSLGNDNVIQINHYFCKTKEEFIDKINKGRANVKQNYLTMEHFDVHNFNNIDDFTAFNFKKSYENTSNNKQ